jgi:hypothetical protein
MRSFIALALFSSLPALAGTPEGDASLAAAKVVQKVLVKPLEAKEGKQVRFTRARMPAVARRVRILEQAPRRDEAGNAFFTFAVDSRGVFEDEGEDTWRRDDIVGCVYAEAGQVFVARGDRHYPAALLLGKKSAEAPAGTCRASDTLAQR